jgi:hypothetical protein
VVCSTVVVVGALLTDSVWVVVVVVVGAGVSTVVQDVSVIATTASSGVRIISFFIVGIVPSKGQIETRASGRCIWNENLHPKRGRISRPERWKGERGGNQSSSLVLNFFSFDRCRFPSRIRCFNPAGRGLR